MTPIRIIAYDKQLKFRVKFEHSIYEASDYAILFSSILLLPGP
jgi:hypothetical protein